MKNFRSVTVPAQPERTEQRAISIVCDLCGREIRQLRKDGNSKLAGNFRERYGDVVEVNVSMKAGEGNLDGGVGETTTFDLCPECFEGKLKPWLEQQGAKAQVESWHS